MRSWRTTLLGVSTIVFALIKGITTGDYTEAVPLILTGIGLIAAKDHNK